MEVVTRAEKQCNVKLDESRSDGRPGATLLDDFISTAGAIGESEAKRPHAWKAEMVLWGKAMSHSNFLKGSAMTWTSKATILS
jgi:hypothetical protein